MYRIKITYDTGDSFHRKDDVVEYLKLEFKNIDKAKQALKDIEEHYYCYMIRDKEWSAGDEDKERALNRAKKSPWYYSPEKKAFAGSWHFAILLKNDEGLRVNEHVFWTGYFEHLVGADIECTQDEGLTFRTGRR